jgi:hypothetical protein
MKPASMKCTPPTAACATITVSTTTGCSASRPSLMQARREEAEMIFRRVGITFAVYGAKDEDGAGTERLIPVRPDPARDPAPGMGRHGSRPAPAGDGAEPLHPRRLPRAGDPQGRHRAAEQVLNNAQFRKEMMGVDVPGGIYSHISGIDIVRAAIPTAAATRATTCWKTTCACPAA